MGSLFGGWQMNGIVTFAVRAAGGDDRGRVPRRRSDASRTRPSARWFNTCTQALNGARQNCASADEAIAWQVQPPFTLRTLTTRLEDVRTERRSSSTSRCSRRSRCRSDADPAAARVVQPVQHPVVRRAEHQRDQRRIRHGGADAGERSTQRADRHQVHVLTPNRTSVASYGLRRSAARSPIGCHGDQLGHPTPRLPTRNKKRCLAGAGAPVDSARSLSFGARPGVGRAPFSTGCAAATADRRGAGPVRRDGLRRVRVRRVCNQGMMFSSVRLLLALCACVLGLPASTLKA